MGAHVRECSGVQASECRNCNELHALVRRNADQICVETADEMHAYYACGNASNVNANVGGNCNEMCGFA